MQGTGTSQPKTCLPRFAPTLAVCQTCVKRLLHASARGRTHCPLNGALPWLLISSELCLILWMQGSQSAMSASTTPLAPATRPLCD